jgi:purine-nucleoside phosphorylase
MTHPTTTFVPGRTTGSRLRAEIDAAVSSLRARTAMVPEVAIILGSGLGALSRSITADCTVPYKEIPHFPESTVEGHAGELCFGRLAGKLVVAMRGRAHFYEGYSIQQVAFPVRVMRAIGARTLIVSNAVGGMNPMLEAGSLFLTVDHINLMGVNPLIGPNDDLLGPRFPDMSEPYDRELLALTERVAREERIPLAKGVFVGVAGPNLETRAEYRFLRAIGGDVVGMSLIPENLVAVHSGMRCLALSVVTDMCLPDALHAASIENILRVAAQAEPSLTRLIERVVSEL